MSIGGMGSWSVHSEKDPRWNKKGRGFGAVSCGGPSELQDWIKECEKNFGKPPNDAVMSFFKD